MQDEDYEQKEVFDSNCITCAMLSCCATLRCAALRGATRARSPQPQLLAAAHNRCAAQLDATTAPPPLLLSPPSTDLA